MTGPARFLTATILAAGLVTFAVGCGGGGAATPEDAFKNAQAAAEKEDWKAYSATMTNESQEMYAGGLAFGAMFMQAGAEPEQAKKIEEALEKHGLTEDVLKKSLGDASIKSPEEGMKKLVEPVKDRGQFIADMMAAFKGMKGFKDQNPVNKSATLKDVKTDGDTAKGTIEFEKDGKKQSDPIAFKKVDGKWLMDLSESMKGPGGPPADGGGIPGDLPTGLPGDLPGDVPAVPPSTPPADSPK